MKTFFASAILFASLILARAEMQTAIPLWPDGAPGALGTKTNDIPTLTPYLPDATNATGAALVICPGGGYQHLSPREGNDYALWLNQHGITCFVLKYRLGADGYRHPAELQDAARAVRTIRARADEFKIGPKRIGIMGSSAGGHVASMLLTHFDAGDTNSADVIERQSSRPDIGILCYPVITMGEFAHPGSKGYLLGRNPPPELVQETSSELHVDANTPPCFIWCTSEDRTVPPENTLMFAGALRKNHVPFDLHIYQKGGHGMGLGMGIRTPPFVNLHPWTEDCLFWLKAQGWVK
jgi:acetyl esterase/lipase